MENALYYRHIPAKNPSNKPPVIILHGWGQSHMPWLPLAHLLNDTQDIYAIDLPGFGQSPEPPSAWGPDEYAACISNWLQKQNISSAHWIGHSFGGKIALTLALNYQVVQSLVLINASALKPTPSWKKRLRFALIGVMGKILKQIDAIAGSQIFKDEFSPRFGSKDYLQASPTLRKTLVKTLHTNVKDRLKHIRVPTLIIWGESDTETPLEIATELYRLIPNAQLTTFPQKGHYLAEDVGSHLMMRALHPFYQSIAES